MGSLGTEKLKDFFSVPQWQCARKPLEAELDTKDLNKKTSPKHLYAAFKTFNEEITATVAHSCLGEAARKCSAPSSAA